MRKFGAYHNGQGLLFGGSRMPAKLMRPKGVKGTEHGRLVTRLVKLAASAAYRERLTLTRTPAGLFVLRGGGAVRGAEKGTSDLTGRARARPVAVEVKIGADELSAEQKRFLRAVIADGGWAFVCRNSIASFTTAFTAAEAGHYVPSDEITKD